MTEGVGTTEEETPEGAADTTPATAARTATMVLDANILNVGFCDLLRWSDGSRRIDLGDDIDDDGEERSIHVKRDKQSALYF